MSSPENIKEHETKNENTADEATKAGTSAPVVVSTYDRVRDSSVKFR